MSWQNTFKLLGVAIVIVEVRQVLLGLTVDVGFLALAAGLMGVAAVYRKDSS